MWLAEDDSCSQLSNCKALHDIGVVADHAALIDLYYTTGQLDNSEPISDQYAVTEI